MSPDFDKYDVELSSVAFKMASVSTHTERANKNT